MAPNALNQSLLKPSWKSVGVRILTIINSLFPKLHGLNSSKSLSISICFNLTMTSYLILANKEGYAN